MPCLPVIATSPGRTSRLRNGMGQQWSGARSAVRSSGTSARTRAVFLDCDFQGAALAGGDLGMRATMTGAQFLRCDLRRSRWAKRTLAGVRFVRCKLHGVLGPDFDGVIIDQPDLSIDDDGSWSGALGDVLALWGRASASPELAGETPHEEASRCR